MWRFLRILLVLSAPYFPLASTAALAQKAASSEGFRWNGFYLGVYAGQAWAESDIRTDAGAASPDTYFTAANEITSINRLASGSIGPDELIAGMQIGANVQTGKFVFGLEADFGSFNLNSVRGGSYLVPNPLNPPQFAVATVGATISTDWLLTARGRIGWTPSSNLLIYATGGLAVTELRVSNSYADDSPFLGVGGASTSKMLFGWALGGGAEWALTRHWSLKAEYMHIDFGSVSTRGSVNCGPASTFFSDCVQFVVPSPLTTSADLSADIARVGLNYKFD